MGLFSKKADPIECKARALEEQIAAVQLEMKRLHRKLEKPQPKQPPQNGHQREVQRPPVRSTVKPHRATQVPNVHAHDPIFEAVDHSAPEAHSDASKAHFNDLGVRKYDLPAAWRRFLSFFRAPAAHNPKLVSYLAAGSIRGLRPLRYEKRVARNRFVLMSVIFLVVLYWLTAVFWRHQ